MYCSLDVACIKQIHILKQHLLQKRELLEHWLIIRRHLGRIVYTGDSYTVTSNIPQQYIQFEIRSTSFKEFYDAILTRYAGYFSLFQIYKRRGIGRVAFTVGPNTVASNIYRFKYILFEIRSTSSKQFYAAGYLSVFLSGCSFYGIIYNNRDNYFKLIIEKIFFKQKIISRDNFYNQKTIQYQ